MKGLSVIFLVIGGVLTLQHHGEMMAEKAMQKCEAYESMYPALIMGDYEISMYPGNCRKDKMEYAMKKMMEQMQQMKNKIIAFKKTRMYLQMHVLNKPYAMADLIFGRVNHCTIMIECKLPGWMKILQKKMDYIKKQIYIVRGEWASLLQKPVSKEPTPSLAATKSTLPTQSPTSATNQPTPSPTSRQKYDLAKPCDPTVCRLPACRCSGPEVPRNLTFDQTPKMITFTMDDGVTQEKFDIFSDYFDGKTNPNGCPARSTYYVSGDFTIYPLCKALYDKGHEIGVHTKTHRFPISWWVNATYEDYVDEIIGMKKQLEDAGIRNLVGYRQPFLQTGGDNTFSVLKEYGFLYDASLPTQFGNLWYPYTLEYDTTPKPCVIPPCPKNSYPELWEISMIPLKDKHGFVCSMFDECGRTFTTEDEVYGFFLDNFNRHFQNSRAPFPVYGHATWMLNGIHRRNGLKRFMSEMYERNDVYVVSMSQTIDWMKNPKTLQQIHRSSGPFSC